MDSTGAGTAIMLAVAAVLWFLYLVPTWLRRREYLATERTATRLQQTIRVMAETAELPDEVRVAATAREAARQERLLRTEQRRADAMAVRQAAVVRRQHPSAGEVRVAPEVLRRRRMRRTRVMASALMVVATAVALVQVTVLVNTGMSTPAALVLGGAVAAGATAIAVQRRLDARAMPRAAAPARSRPAVRVASYEADEAPASWTPQQMPKPLYLSRPAPEVLAPRPDIEEALRVAAASAEQTLRDAQAAREVVPLRAVPKPSKYAGMGVLDPSLTQTPDLDEVLRRRRSAG